MSAIPPVTGASAATSEQIEALVRMLAPDEQTCIDLLGALAVIPSKDLTRIIRAASLGWVQDRAGHYSLRIDKCEGRPAIVRLQPGEQIIGPERRRDPNR